MPKSPTSQSMTSAIVSQPMERAHLLRVIDISKVCVLLRETGAIVQAELSRPLSPRSHVAAQSVHALAGIPARVFLGPYDSSKYMFTDCYLEADFPETKASRLDYSSRMQAKKAS